MEDLKLELRDDKGLIGTIELPLEQLREGLGLGSVLVAEPKATEALKVEVQSFEAQLKESHGKVAELEEKLATAEGRTMDDFTQIEKANFVLAWGKGLSPENKAIFARAIGMPIAKATEAEVAEAEAKGEAGEEPTIIQGKTDRPGFKFLEHLNLSVREK